MIRRHAGLLLTLACVACSTEPADLRDWRPSDHDHTETPSRGQVPTDESGKAKSPAAMLGIDEVVLTTWKQKCTSCHGMIGQGDGPRGRESGARNLGDPAWQSTVSDETLAASIRDGKGNMPAHALPESTIAGLVKLVRKMAPQIAPGDAAPGAPAGSAPNTADAQPPAAPPPTRPSARPSGP